MSKERCIVVGAGGISRVWFKAIKAENLNVVSVVDLNVPRAHEKLAQFEISGTEVSDNLKAMLKKHRPDFVVDCTVPEAHCQVTCETLRAGVPVIGEKPMAAGMDEARKMVRASEKAKRLYMVSQSRRWDGKHDRVRRSLQAGRIGPITTVNCDFYIGAHFGGFRDKMPSPLILDMAIHHFDLARFMTGLDPLAVYAKEFNPKGSWYKGDVAASCIFEMTGGVIFTYRGSWCAEGFHTSWNGDWRIIGSKGTLLYDHDQDPKAQVVVGKDGFDRSKKEVNIPASPLKFTGMHGALREMLTFLRTGKKPQTECHDNIKSLAMVFAAIESSKLGKRIPVRY